jgi:hypothetical protein
MRWDFWNRNKKSGNAASEQPAPPSAAASGAPGGPGFPVLNSPREILGLQQLVGNQEVLRMLDPGRVKRVPRE